MDSVTLRKLQNRTPLENGKTILLMHAKTSNNTENGDNEESSTDKDNNGICLPSSEDSLSS